MTIVEFAIEPNHTPADSERRSTIMSAREFGQHQTDHMVSINYTEGQGWHDAKVTAYGPIELAPSALGLHYGQEVIEGLKAYRWTDGSIMSFRPDAHAARLRASCRRLAMPELPDHLFLESLRHLITVDAQWIPAAHEGFSLYLRPFVVATEPTLALRPAKQYRYLLIASPTKAGITHGLKPVTVWLAEGYARAFPGGTGAFKVAGNYAASLAAQAQAVDNGCDQVVWLDAVERRYIEEMGGMNIFFVFGRGSTARLVTPELTGSILPGVTRDSLLKIAADCGLAIEERRIDVAEWRKEVAAGEITEVFACGTAAVVTPVSRVKHHGGEFPIADGRPGEITRQMRKRLTGIQQGKCADKNQWMLRLG
ncbi:branched-chain amino acid aminotransferase [Mycobacterium sp. MUNTM1]